MDFGDGLSGVVALVEKWPVLGRHEQAAVWLGIWVEPRQSTVAVDLVIANGTSALGGSPTWIASPRYERQAEYLGGPPGPEKAGSGEPGSGLVRFE